MSRRAKPDDRGASMARLRELREMGTSRLKDYEVTQDVAIYDEVTEEEFNTHAKKRMQEDDWIVGDTGDYTHQDEDWDRDQEYSQDEEEEMPKGKKTKKAKKDEPKSKDLVTMFNQVKSVPVRPLQKSVDSGLLLDSIMADLDREAGLDQPVSQTTRPKPLFGLPMARPTVKHAERVSTVQLMNDFNVDNDPYMDSTDYPGDQDDEPSPNAMAMPITETVKKSPVNENMVTKVAVKSISSKKAVGKASAFLPKFEKKEIKEASVVSAPLASDCTNWNELKDTIGVSASTASASTYSSSQGLGELAEEDGSLLMYWFDAFEKNGSVTVFGKILHKPSGKYLSTSVIVDNISRNLFVLPRTRQVDATGHETDIEVSIPDVYEEFNSLRRKHNIQQFDSKVVSRQYAFEIPGVPTESDYLKVSYSFKDPVIPHDVSGRSFSRIFGTNTSALEHFIIKRKLMGPCWVRITDPRIHSKSLSWCKIELQMDDPKKFTVLPESEAKAKVAPPFTVMSISMRTVMNHKKRTNEIVAISALVYSSVSTDGGNVPDDAQRFTAIRQLNGIPWPVGFNDMIQSSRVKAQVMTNEMGLLNLLLANIKKHDPDVLVGHNFVDFDLDVLLHRMKQNNTRDWSCLGRLRRTAWPKLQGGAGGTADSSFGEKQIVCGRLICDTYRVSKDLIRAKSYGLTNLSATQLKIDRPNIEYDRIPDYFWDAKALFAMVQHCEFDAWLCGKLMSQLQALPLTKQLTNLAGNLWSRTLCGGRAERNEYLLLHEFHERKFICPDKLYNNPFTPEVAANADGDEDEGEVEKKTSKGRRKPAYAGGLVLEPKKGLYDKYILMLDFNSLYPSIIQEYNICFTTVVREYDTLEEHLPSVPDPSLAKGVLPKLLGTLVNRRYQVKALMKDPKTTPVEYAQYDIRQKALKLTANSMYGCLGFTHSRFFAKPLASLITAKGREILQNTVDLAQQSSLDVIYGDTDSIMINTNSTDLNEVKKIGMELKKAVNKRYTLLEIELDGFFKRMLLLQKKKYAAILVEEKNGKLIETKEMKGLDLVRRDWCGLSHDVSNYVLDQIFSGENKEDVVDKIHSYLEKVGLEVRSGLIPIEKYVITKGLTKNPEEYADKNSQPHVQVAMRLKSRGLTAKVGDTIPYVICKGESSTVSARAYHPDDVTKAGSELEIDFEWYLSNQIHPPVSRLCQPIEGTDNARLATCLGLDVAKFARIVVSNVEEDLFTLESTIPVQERFKNVQVWEPKCAGCGTCSKFEPIVRIRNGTVISALECPNQECGKHMHVTSLLVQLRVAIRSYLRNYMDQSVVCDDAACHTRTRDISVFGRRCLMPGCRGTVNFEYSDAQLHTQMQYLLYLFDVEKCLEEYKESPLGGILGFMVDSVRLVISRTSQVFASLKAVVDRHMELNARQFVDLKGLFSHVSSTSLPMANAISV